MIGLLSVSMSSFAAPRVNANVGFEQFTDGTTLQQSNFINGSTWSYFDDESCIGGGNPRKCVLGWRSTITPSSSTSRVEVAYASTYGYTNSSRIVAEVNSTAPSRLYYNICLTQGESVNVSYQFAPRSGVAAQQVRVGLWPLNSGYPATAISSKNSQSRTFSSTTSPGFTTETASLTAPSAGAYQLGLEAVTPTTGSVGNIIDDLSFTLIPLIDLGVTETYTLKEGGGSEAIKSLRIRINGTVPSGGVTVALRRSGTAVDQDIQLGTPTGLVGTTPTISHPSADIWLVYIPAGAYDAGELGDTLRYGITIPISAIQDALLENPETLQFTLQSPGEDGATGSGVWRRANPVCEGNSQTVVSYNVVPAARVRLAQDNQNTEPRSSELYSYHIEIENEGVSQTATLDYTTNSQLITDRILLAQGTHTLSLKQSIQGQVPLGRVSPYQTQLICTNTNTDTIATMPSPSVITSQAISFSQSQQITLQNLGDGDDVTCTFYNRHEAGSFLVQGRVFNDNSGTTGQTSFAYDALQQAGELGLAQTVVNLTNCQDTILGRSQTDAKGDYQFIVPRTVQIGAPLCVQETNLQGYASVSGGDASAPSRYQYDLNLDRVMWINGNTATGATIIHYDRVNFGDAWLKMRLLSDGQSTIRPAEVASYPHQLYIDAVITPDLTTLFQQQPANTNDAPWTTVLYRDDNCNGVVDPSEPSLAQAPYGLQLPNTMLCVVQRVNAPTQVGVGAQGVVVLTPSYRATRPDGRVLSGTGDPRQDTTLIGGARLEMKKAVRTVSNCAAAILDTSTFSLSNTATYGSFLEYEITFLNNGIKPLQQIHVRDSTPAGTIFGTGYCSLIASGTQCQLASSPLFGQTGGVDFLVTGSLQPQQHGSVRFCVQVN
jgi:uncharacterized repeat protein (TIGR01451 family)